MGKQLAMAGTILGAVDGGIGAHNVNKATSREIARSYMQANPHATATEVLSDTASNAAYAGAEGTAGIALAGLCAGVLYLNRKFRL